MNATAPDTRRPWFEREPKRRAWELAEFRARGLAAEDIVIREVLQIHTRMPFRGDQLEIIVEFPAAYPDFPPTVFGPPVLPRHQVLRSSGNFCLLEQPHSDWWPSMSAAELVDEDLRWLLEDSDAGPATVAAGEADMPEPLSGHLPYERETAMLVPDPFWTLELACTRGDATFVDVRSERCWVLAGVEGIGAADAALIEHFASSRGQRHLAVWVDLGDAAPGWPTADEVLAAAEARDDSLLRRLRKPLRRDPKRRRSEGWVAITFIEEGPQRGQRRRAWAFLRVALERGGDRSVLAVVRAQALTARERARRVPELVGLEAATVLVVGAGSLGGPVTLELAKAGVGTIDVVDQDFYDVNNAVRHVVPTRRAGADKALAVAFGGEDLNPFVNVVAHHLTVGSNDADRRLDRLLASADVVVDTTGSASVSRLLQRRCADGGTPLVVAALTAASYGGEVARFLPGGPCFLCFVLHQADGTVPTPEEGPRSNVTPIGCSHPAFAGAGFDATAIAALAARTVVVATGTTTYPASANDYVVVNFRDGAPWSEGVLRTHPGCPLCS